MLYDIAHTSYHALIYMSWLLRIYYQVFPDRIMGSDVLSDSSTDTDEQKRRGAQET